MKTAILSVTYKEERFIHHFTQHYKGLTDKILVLNSLKPWHGEATEADYTKDIAEANGAEVIQGDWKDEKDQRNFGLTQLVKYDWVFILDPDEFFIKEDFLDLKEHLKIRNANNAIKVQLETYWKYGYKLVPIDTHRPLVAVRPTEVYFHRNRGITSEVVYADYMLHHFSWARTDEEVKRKMMHYGHVPDFDTMKWYKEVWLKWTPEMKQLHPFDTTKWKEAVECIVPKELQPVLDSLKEMK